MSVQLRALAHGGTTSMKMLLLAGATVLALSATVATASAAPIPFGFTGTVQTFTATSTGVYEIVAFGAQGGSGSSIASGNTPRRRRPWRTGQRQLQPDCRPEPVDHRWWPRRERHLRPRRRRV